MCYDVAYLTRKIEYYEKRFGADYGKKPFTPIYHSTGFDHMDLPVMTVQSPKDIQLYGWGLIPYWAKGVEQANKIQNSTLNARDSNLFEKSSFRDAAKAEQRCLILVDGFYDFHWENGKSYPYHITSKDGEAFAFGGIWSHWISEDIERYTVSLITTDPNERMAWIHNQPKASEGPRMPFIVPRELETTWLAEGLDPQEVKDMIKPYPEELLVDYTVPRLRGKAYKGNVMETMRPFRYQELESEQGSLF